MLDKEFKDSLELAFQLCNKSSCFCEAIKRINSIESYDYIKGIYSNSKDMLYQWVPTIVFNLFGYETYQNCDLNIDANSSFIIFRPNKKYDFSVLQMIKDTMLVDEYKYKFSPRLIGTLYGGFPWFLSYYRICKDLGIIDSTGFAFRITSKNKSELIVMKLFYIKNEYREMHSEQTVKIQYDKWKYNGVIHAFHTPNCIENVIHCRAIERELL